MALIKCPECKSQISEFALSCPNCGFPLSEEIVTKIKINEQKKIDEALKAKEQKELERREFLDSFNVSNSDKEKIPTKKNQTGIKISSFQQAILKSWNRSDTAKIPLKYIPIILKLL